MAYRKPRILRDIPGFNDNIIVTCKYIMTPCDPSPSTNGTRLGWKTEEIAQWNAFYEEWKPLYILYANKKAGRTTAVKDELKLIIKRCRAYEHKQHLYERIALNTNAITKDFVTFNIKHDTPIEKTKHGKLPNATSISISLRLEHANHNVHRLKLNIPGSTGIGKPEGVKDIMIFMAYTKFGEGQPAEDKFHYFGDAKRGFINIIHDTSMHGYNAWYYACTKNTRGKMGVPGPIKGCLVI
jgi:hypothetical protein